MTKVTRQQGADIRYREYWRDNERFADLFNTVAFGGNTVVNPDELQELDTRVSRLISDSDSEHKIERTRDIMKVSHGAKYLLLGVENQTHIHYGMPLKALTYDVLGYIDEAKHISEKRKKEKGLNSAEFLSGMRKEDRLTPIITLIIYYGEEVWDAPLSLSEMFKDDEQWNSLIQTEHRILLLQVCNSEQYHFQNKDTETIFSISRELFKGNLTQVKNKYNTKDLSQEILAMVGSITGFRGMEQVAEKGEQNMCKAIDAIFEQERIKTEERMCKGLQDALDKERIDTEQRMLKLQSDALNKARIDTEQRMLKLNIIDFIQTLKEFQCDTDDICNRLFIKYNLSKTEAERYLSQVN